MRKVSFGKRLISMLLVLVLVFGIMPTSIWAANDTVLDAAIFCSDLHGKTANLESILGHLKGSDVKYSSIGLVGDTCLTVSGVTSTIGSALGYTPNVMFSYAKSHDTENSADIATNWNYSGEVENVSNYYLVYTIRETDMQNASDAATAAPAFTTWYNGLTAAEKTLPIFIMSHRPMHDRRDDNAGAATWYNAISAAAESSDIVFFWGHNHTGDNSVDQAAYYVAKDGTETMTIYNGSSVVPNFTYMNAGYIDANGQNPARKPVATTVQIYADKLVFQDYTTSGTYSGSYAHNVTVEREFATKITPTTLKVTGVIEYAVGDALKAPSKVEVTYSDGSTKELSASDLKLTITTEDGADLEDNKFVKAGTYKLTYSYTENGQTAAAVLTVTVKVGMTSVEDYAYVNEDDADSYGYYVEATGMGLTGMNATYVWEEYLSVFGDTFLDFLAFDIALEGHTAGDDVTYVLELDEFISLQNLCLYYVDENNALTPIAYKLIEQNGGLTYLEFTANHDGVFLYGNVTVPEDYELSHITVDYQGAVKYLVGDDFDMVNILVNAVYTKEGAEDFVTQIYAMGYGVEDGYEFTAPDMTTSGVKTVTLTYGGKSVSFQISVYEKNLTHAATGVSVELTVPGASKVEATDVTTSNGSLIAAVGHLLENYKAYDIELVGYNDGEKVIVTLPVPAGVENPVVLYVSDDGKTVQNMGATKNDDGTVSFETDHFSVYTVGDSTEITVPDPTTATVTGSTTESKEVYVKVDKISAAGDYLLVDVASATTSANLLTASSSSVTNTSGVTVVSGKNAAGTSILYIEDPAAAAIWTASGSNNSYKLYNSSTSRYLQRSSSTLTVTSSSSSATSWKTSTSNAVYYDGNTDRYIRYNSGWSSLNSGSGTVYIYQKQTVEFVTSVNGTYSIEGNPDKITKVVVDGSTATLGSTLTFTPDGSTESKVVENATVSYTVVENGDPNGIISGISGNTVTFSGNYGKALVKVSYTPDGSSQTATNYIVVTASAPYYEVSIKNGDKDVTGTTVSLKGITNGQTIALSALVNMITSDGSTPVEGATLEWHIPEEYQNIATIDHDTGLVTLKGVDGAFYITVTYTKDGQDYTAGVNFSVTTTQYSNPNDGTADFPEYPNEGAVRFDKVATAVGNFSETGIAQVELSMTGVPYTTGSEIDVVVMLDMTGSMSDDGMEAAELATIAFMEKIVKNEDGTYNENRIAVYAFNSGSSSPYELVSLKKITSDAELTTATTAIKTASDKQASGGTPFDEAAQKCQSVLSAAKTDGIGNNRQQFCVFMSDGGPTSYAADDGDGTYTTITNSGSGSTAISTYFSGYSSATSSSWSFTLPTEYYTNLMKADDVTVYTVGLLLQNKPSNPSPYSSMTASTYNSTTDSLTTIGSHYYFTSRVLKQMASSDDKYIDIFDVSNASKATAAFESIALSILQAATDIVVEDKITDEYTMIFDIPTGSKDITGVTNDFYIQFLKYTLDADHERTGTPTSMTKLYLKNTDGTLSAAKDSTGTAYDAPVFENKVIGEKGTLYFWTTDSSKSDSGISTTVNGTTYYFVPYGIKATDDGYDATKWFNMTSGAYATGTINSETNMSENVVIATPYFVYNAATRMLYWTVDKLDTEEYALRYFLYLDNSATEVGTNKEIDPGSYPTNEYAYLTYTNFKGNDCRQEMPVPQQTWSGAQVSYVFYLVNAAGQPINKSGQVVDFANATFITDIYTESTVWNKGEDGKITADSKLSIDWLANELLPSDYMVYDLNAQYQLHVYGDHTGASIFDYFTIDGSTQAEISASLNSRLEGANTTASSVSAITTKVYNTKAGEKIAGYGTYTSKATTSIDNEKVLEGFDFYNTTVAFAVVWQPKLVEDTVVVDFGLDVLINVVENDILQNKVTGIGLGNSAYGNIAMNTGVSADSKLGTDGLTIDGHTIRIENETSIRFHQNNMTFTKPVVFYYESPVEFYEGSDKKEGYMHSMVTVIPATSIYYEDSFISQSDLKTYEWADTAWDETATGIGTGVFSWQLDGSAENKTQSQDRPGTSQISAVLDADNKYGYDGAYANMSTYSMGSALKVHVDYDHMATASFSFYGTGFDLISMTSNTTGTIIVNVYDSKNAQVESFVVNTYYGMTAQYWNVTYTYENGEWVKSGEEMLTAMGEVKKEPENPAEGATYTTCEIRWIETDTDNALYQVPVIKIDCPTYGKYTAEIKVVYDPIFDQGLYDNASYDFYLDAIRIYDPTGNNNDTANGAYVADGEGWPLYKELRNLIVSADSFGSDITVESEGKSATTEVGGAVFIDGIAGNTVIANYESFGPNNELYLAPGQSVAFQIADAFVNAKGESVDPVDVQLAVKSVQGAGVLEIFNPGAKVTTTDDGNGTQTTTATATKENLLKLTPGATDLYYSIKDLAGGTIVIANPADSGATISITNLKFTFDEKAEVVKETTVDANGITVETEASVLSISEEAVVYAMRSLSGHSTSSTVYYDNPAPTPDTTTPNGNAPEDNTTEDNTSGDNTTDDNTSEDNTSDDNTSEDNTTDDDTSKDDTVDDDTTEEEESGKDETTEPEEELGWFARILRAIGNFFRKIFGWIFN